MVQTYFGLYSNLFFRSGLQSGAFLKGFVVVDRKYKKINMIVDESTHRHNLQYVI